MNNNETVEYWMEKASDDLKSAMTNAESKWFCKTGCRLLFCALAVFAILACTARSKEEPVKSASENTLNIDVSVPLGSLNPHEIVHSGSSYVFPYLHGYLVFPDGNGELQGDLAESWRYDPETFTWIITLREDARFHDGRPVTSEDVRYSLYQFLSKKMIIMAENIDYVAARALNSVEIKLKRDGPNLIKKIWDWEILPSPEKGRFDYYHNPIGAGAFRFSHREGDRLVCLEANEDYHGKIPYLKRICWHYEPDKEKTWGRLLAGKTDVAQDVLPYNAEIMEKFSGRFHFSRSPSSHITLLLFNTRMELFSKAEVRRAITHAIDRKYIVEKILKGRGKTISGPFGINSPYYNPDIPFPLEHDPQKAMALLKKAGWRRDETGWLVNGENEPFEFTLFLIRENSMDLEIGQYLQLALNDLGIRVRLISLTIHNFLHRYIRNTDFQAVLTEVTGLHNIPENLKNLWAGDKNLPSAMGTFENKRLTFLIQHFLDKTGMDEKKRLGIEIQKAFQEIQPATFLYQKASLDVLSKRIRCASDFMFDYSGAYGLKYAQVVKE